MYIKNYTGYLEVHVYLWYNAKHRQIFIAKNRFCTDEKPNYPSKILQTVWAVFWIDAPIAMTFIRCDFETIKFLHNKKSSKSVTLRISEWCTIRRGVKQNNPVDCFVAESPCHEAECTARTLNGSEITRIKQKSTHYSECLLVVHHQGLEPGTPWLRVRCSTNWANGAFRQHWILYTLRCALSILFFKKRSK